MCVHMYRCADKATITLLRHNTVNKILEKLPFNNKFMPQKLFGSIATAATAPFLAIVAAVKHAPVQLLPSLQYIMAR